MYVLSEPECQKTLHMRTPENLLGGHSKVQIKIAILGVRLAIIWIQIANFGLDDSEDIPTIPLPFSHTWINLLFNLDIIYIHKSLVFLAVVLLIFFFPTDTCRGAIVWKSYW